MLFRSNAIITIERGRPLDASEDARRVKARRSSDELEHERPPDARGERPIESQGADLPARIRMKVMMSVRRGRAVGRIMVAEDADTDVAVVAPFVRLLQAAREGELCETAGFERDPICAVNPYETPRSRRNPIYVEG